MSRRQARKISVFATSGFGMAAQRLLVTGMLLLLLACAGAPETWASAGGADVGMTAADGVQEDDVQGDGVQGDGGVADSLTSCRMTPGCACNGHPALCDRRLDQVVFPATHNAMNNKAEGWLFPNQNFGLKRQLDDGIRGFLMDTHSWDNPDDKSTASWLCHGSCQLGSIRLVDALAIFTTFLKTHPDEVLLFVVEDKLSPAKFVEAMAESGLDAYAIPYVLGSKFATLRALIQSNKRLLVTTENKGGPPPWLLRFNDLGFDTPYEFKTMAAIQVDSGPDDSCRKFRGTVGAPIFLMNHWVAKVLPTPVWSAQANVRSLILKRAKRCAALHGRLPTMVAVDHYDLGDVFGAVRELNGLE